MNAKLGKIIKLTPWLFFAIGALMLVSALVMNALPEKVSYFYEGGEIIERSWHDCFRVISVCVTVLVLLWLLTATVTVIVRRIKLKEKTEGKLALLWLAALICIVTIGVSNLSIVGIWTKDIWSPVCYEFTDGIRTIVIEEKSFMLDGRSTIYQIMDDGTAVIIGEFGTDDGIRNNGEYEIEWSDGSAEITYRTFVSADDTDVITVEFE